MSNTLPNPNRGYISTKTYTHEAGFTCCFRQWRAQSHCRFLHGYPLKVKFVFGARELDSNNWVVDFGGLKDLKGWLEDWFDHTTLVAIDDPQLSVMESLASLGVIQMRVVPSTGCESFASFILEYAEQWLVDAGFSPRCYLISVEVSEHGGNSAVCLANPLTLPARKISV